MGLNFQSLDNCESCKQRKEALKTMLGDHKFWIGVVVGVGVYWGYGKFVKKG